MESPDYWETDNQEPHPKDVEWAERKARETAKDDIEDALDWFWVEDEERSFLALKLWIRSRMP